MAFFLIMVEFFLVCLFLVFIAIFKDITVRKDIWKLEKMYHKLLTNHHIKYFHVTWASTRRFHLWIWNYLFKEELPEELIICILSRELNWRVIPCSTKRAISHTRKQKWPHWRQGASYACHFVTARSLFPNQYWSI